MGGGGGDTTTVQKADPWKGQQPYIKNALIMSQAGINAPQPRISPYSNIAPFTERALALQEGLGQFGKSPLYKDIGSGLMSAFDQAAYTPGALQTAAQYAPNYQGAPVTGAGLGPNVGLDFGPSLNYSGLSQLGTSQPVTEKFERKLWRNLKGKPQYNRIRGLQEAAAQPLIEQFQEEIMPGIRRQGIAAGQVGGSRAGVAQGIASGKLARALGEQNQRIAESERNRALALQQQAMGIMGGYGQQGRALDFARQQMGVQTGADLAKKDLELGLQAEQIRGQTGLGLGGLAQQQQALAGTLGPQLLKQGLLPYQLGLATEDTRRRYAQQLMDEQAQKLAYQEKLPFAALDDYLRRIYGPGPLGGTSTSQVSPGISPLAQAGVNLGANAASTALAYSLL